MPADNYDENEAKLLRDLENLPDDQMPEMPNAKPLPAAAEAQSTGIAQGNADAPAETIFGSGGSETGSLSEIAEILSSIEELVRELPQEIKTVLESD